MAKRSHPACHARRLDAWVEPSKKVGAEAADGEARTSDAAGVHLRARHKVIDAADVVPGQDSSPCNTRINHILIDYVLHFAVAVVDLVYRFFRLDLGMVIDSALQVFVKDQATVPEIVHVDGQDHVTVTRERGRITDDIVRLRTEGGERPMLVL